MKLTAVSIPVWMVWKVVVDEIRRDVSLAPILQGLETKSGEVSHYSLINGAQYCRDRLVLS